MNGYFSFADPDQCDTRSLNAFGFIHAAVFDVQFYEQHLQFMQGHGFYQVPVAPGLS
jgi:hypothetical protein